MAFTKVWSQNNLGVTLLEQFKYPEAAEQFRQALTIDSSLAIARVNLGIALLYAQDLAGAAKEATEAARLLPSARQPPYVVLRQAVAAEPYNVTAAYNLGLALTRGWPDR